MEIKSKETLEEVLIRLNYKLIKKKDGKIIYQCSCGNICQDYPSEIKAKKGYCKKCIYLFRRNSQESIEKKAKEKGCLFLDKWDFNAPKEKKYKFQCKCEIIFYKRWDAFLATPNCSKCARLKTEKTCLNKYGGKSPMSSDIVKKKVEKTILKKYGVKNIFSKKEVIEKIKENNLKKYGFEYAMQNKKVQEKVKQTCLQKYGTDNPSKNIDIINKIKSKSKETYRKAWETMKEKGNFRKSKEEDAFFNYLITEIDKTTQRQVFHKGFYMDFYLPKYNVYVQYDGDYWHGLLHTEEELIKTKQGKVILETKKRDKIQNRIISNLIRIKGSKFKKDKNIFKFKLRLNSYLMEKCI